MKFLTPLFLLITSLSFSQSIEPASIGKSGGVLDSNGVSLEFAVGDILVSGTASDSISISGGYISGTRKEVVTDLKAKELVDFKAYPNPFSEYIKIENPALEVASVLLQNAEGKLILERSVLNEKLIELNLTKVTEGYYLITLFDRNKKVKGTFTATKIR